eukprot:5642911-Pleurochrysis_carterae.AAC.1
MSSTRAQATLRSWPKPQCGRGAKVRRSIASMRVKVRVRACVRARLQARGRTFACACAMCAVWAVWA